MDGKVIESLSIGSGIECHCRSQSAISRPPLEFAGYFTSLIFTRATVDMP